MTILLDFCNINSLFLMASSETDTKIRFDTNQAYVEPLL